MLCGVIENAVADIDVGEYVATEGENAPTANKVNEDHAKKALINHLPQVMRESGLIERVAPQHKSHDDCLDFTRALFAAIARDGGVKSASTVVQSMLEEL
ncbi:hypothetical protein KIPB_009148 [Kipferlia bialata]|uniref:Uncharacterized protein n=1 Tax=Kipferlia bialata TaxID=797122 RepID=A0A9K3GLD0_9EUKA|nr:hypothetical protein KIPB_009148 [Kipferlia bialata]|eukprot:g9148.t1